MSALLLEFPVGPAGLPCTTCGPATSPDAAEWPCPSSPELSAIAEKVQNARHWPLRFCHSASKQYLIWTFTGATIVHKPLSRASNWCIKSRPPDMHHSLAILEVLRDHCIDLGSHLLARLLIFQSTFEPQVFVLGGTCWLTTAAEHISVQRGTRDDATGHKSCQVPSLRKAREHSRNAETWITNRHAAAPAEVWIKAAARNTLGALCSKRASTARYAIAAAAAGARQLLIRHLSQRCH